jgi:fatty-acyl-CoA synthase
MSAFASSVEQTFYRGRIASLRDIEHIESVPLAQRITSGSVYEIVSQAAHRHPNKAAFITLLEGHLDEQATELRYGELLNRIHQLAHLLRSLGVNRNDSVAVLLPNVVQAFWVPLAISLAGTAFPLNWMLEKEALASQLLAVRPKAIIALGPLANFRIWENVCAARSRLSVMPPLIRVDLANASAVSDSLDALCDRQPNAAPSWLQEQDAFSGNMLMIATGGTTGDPKIAPIRHDAVLYKVWACVSLMDMRPEHRAFGVLPQFHVGGIINGTFSSLAIGSTIVIPGVAGLRAKHVMRDYWQLIERFRITDLSGVPTTLGALSQTPVDADISSLRNIGLTGSAGLPASIGRHLERVAGVCVLGSYGMTENTSSACMPPRDGDPRYGSCGIRYPYTQVKVVRWDEDGTPKECETGEHGEVLVRSPGLIHGFLEPSHNLNLFHDGWLRTGDLGWLEDDGYLWITGRRKDVIIRGGHNIDPRTIEEALIAHPGVRAAAAVGRPDAYAGELPVAFVQLKPNSQVDADTLLEFVRDRIQERAAIPVKLSVLQSLPLTAVGKVFRPELRRLAVYEVFQQILTNLVEAGRVLRLDAESNAGGVSVRIKLASRGADDVGLEQQLSEAFERFMLPVHIEWQNQ